VQKVSASRGVIWLADRLTASDKQVGDGAGGAVSGIEWVASLVAPRSRNRQEFSGVDLEKPRFSTKYY